VKYLLDANVWLTGMTGQAEAVDANNLILTAPPSVLALTDFALHAIGLILTSVKRPEQFHDMLHDLSRRHVWTLHLAPSELHTVLDLSSQLGLDFDDAFQYFAAERFDLKIVSFDADFDRTPRGRLTPAQALQEIASAGATP
jgi:predicted nucleic acid-binding protein